MYTNNVFKSLLEKKINQDFKNKNFVLTGYSSGIGNQIYKHLTDLGANIILIGRQFKKKNFFNCDLSDSLLLEKVVKKISQKYKKIDGFVHCAGMNHCLLSEQITLSKWQQIISVNLTSAFIISKQIKKNLKKSRNSSIVFVSSIAGHRKSIVSGAHYVASKAALIGLSKQLSHEYGKDGIRVNCVSPSQTLTKMLQRSMNKSQISKLVKNIPMGRLAKVEEQSYGVIFLLSSFSRYISGTSLNIDGGQV